MPQEHSNLVTHNCDKAIHQKATNPIFLGAYSSHWQPAIQPVLDYQIKDWKWLPTTLISLH